jgi:FixJ family two-component response regulator
MSILSSSKVVFVVDDDPAVLSAVQRVLKNNGFDAETFNSASELRAYNNLEQAFCVVLDVDLGAESGITLHSQLRAAGIEIPVIYISGKHGSKAAALASGCVAFLPKPFSAKSLIEPIRNLWDSLPVKARG